jgi:hypothetical protein
MSDNELADLYLKTRVTIEEDGLMVDAADAKVVKRGVVYVITAWNPGDLRPTEKDNLAANATLRGRLVELGLHPIRAVGSDPDSTHFEESWAVSGLTDAEARAIGADFGQAAIFRLEARSQTVLGCAGQWEVSRTI